MKNFVEELKWRGMIQDIIPGTEEKLMELLHDDKLTYSIGINYDYPFEIYQNR